VERKLGKDTEAFESRRLEFTRKSDIVLTTYIKEKFVGIVARRMHSLKRREMGHSITTTTSVQGGKHLEKHRGHKQRRTKYDHPKASVECTEHVNFVEIEGIVMDYSLRLLQEISLATLK
jgi:hypothetical protein